MIRALIRRWLGVPSNAEARDIALREIDADAAWKAKPPIGVSMTPPANLILPGLVIAATGILILITDKPLARWIDSQMGGRE